MKFLLPIRLIVFCFINALFFSCSENHSKLFTKLSEIKTGINFRSLLKEDNPQFNILFYPYYYNGGGVAVGDINNDGLIDVCFTGNMVKNRLYINKGNFKFDDITGKSGIAAKEGWCTGITMVDINNDGWLDIYICRSGLPNVAYRKNLLFINNHDLTFTEKAAEYGLDDHGYSTQASFFDYDKDGDLDLFLINQSTPEYSRGKIEYVQLRNQRGDTALENKLYRNDNGHFVNVTYQSGIRSNKLTFSLGISTADINQDGWPDIYVANDFKEPDYLYINNHDGTFTDSLSTMINHTSLYSMGIDVNDYNNDLLPDIAELDMLPEGNHALKMHMGADNFDVYNYLFKNGMPYQYMKNSLQKNNGDGTFSEIGQLAGISSTDWSWSPLLCDFDNDGQKDLFITNGYKRDNTDIEFIKYSMDQSLRLQQGGDVENVAEYISHMPSIKLHNYIYQNKGNDEFEQKMNDWGFDEPTVSHGAVYADLDNDGDMDLVVNNTDDYAGVYQNNSEQVEKKNFLNIKLQGDTGNSAGIGAKVIVYAANESAYQEELPVRGFQSSVDPVLHFGLGDKMIADSILVIWPDDKMELIKNVKANQLLIVKEQDATGAFNYPILKKPTSFFEKTNAPAFTHTENELNDFTVQPLLPQYYSRQGPCMAKADVNGDGREDVFIGGAKGQAGALYSQSADGNFSLINTPAFTNDANSEDVDAVFFDADNDKDLDLYVISGGYEFAENAGELKDRLYINDGKGLYTKKENALPEAIFNKSCVRPCDMDGDGDMDLFIGGSVVPGKWPQSTASRILLNDGKGIFTDAAAKLNNTLSAVGMVKDAAWVDVNNDKIKDLVIAGEWMPVKVFINKKGKLEDASANYISFASNGWWNKILTADFDKDGDDDLVLGNYGNNSQLNASEKQPAELYSMDIDGNGTIDPVLTSFVQGKAYPFITMDDINAQAPILKKKFYDYNAYADAAITDIINPGKLSAFKPLQVFTFSTVYLENTGKGFVKKALPVQAQYSPVYAMCSMDVNKDGKTDLLLFGNNLYNRIRLTQYNANFGQLYLGDGKGNFAYVPQYQSGLSIKGDVRSVTVVNDAIIIGINNQSVQLYKLKN
ncbi:MAG: VCBS repeat-containing protein [Sphingobacteriales bacterium]